MNMLRLVYCTLLLLGYHSFLLAADHSDVELKSLPDQFDLKQSKGGIVDIEFLVQYLVLKHANDCEDITIWTDNMRLLESLDGEGIITGCEAERLQNAYLAMRKAIHHRNLLEKDQQVPDEQFRQHQEYVSQIYQKC